MFQYLEADVSHMCPYDNIIHLLSQNPNDIKTPLMSQYLVSNVSQWIKTPLMSQYLVSDVSQLYQNSSNVPGSGI